MKVHFKLKAILLAASSLGVIASNVPARVFAAGAGGDSNATGTQPTTNPSINWSDGGANGAVGANTDVSGSTPATGSSLAGISWHTTADYSKLTLMRVPNFDFGAWAFTGGAAGSGSTNSTWYPIGSGSVSGAPYNNSGVAGNPNYAPLAASAAAPVENPVGSSKYDISNSNRVLEVNDPRHSKAGWKVQLKVGDFTRQVGSPNGAAEKLTGAAIAIVPANISFKRDSTDNLVNTNSPSAASTTPIVVYAGSTSPTTLFRADQSDDTSTSPVTNRQNVGQGKWVVDFTDKQSALFTSPTEGLGTYTSTLTWTLTSGPN
ncbi:MAG: WxL domain-containing protein [Bombilactobacillus sp.]